MNKLDSKGFTIVELLVAITFFSFLLLLITYGFVQINRAYTRGITTKTLQESARTITEDLARTLRISDNVSITPPGATTPENGWKMLLGDDCYVWNQQSLTNSTSSERTTRTYTSGNTISMLKGDSSLCSLSSIPEDNDYEIVLDDRAIVQQFSVANVGPSVFKVVVVLSTEDANNNDLEAYGYTAKCKVQIGDQFCDVARYETSIFTRN